MGKNQMMPRELEMLRKDAERYRYIRTHCASLGMHGREWLWDQPDAEAALDRFVDDLMAITRGRCAEARKR